MRYAAFFRNLNLGRPRCPTRSEFEAAFLSSGASLAASFLSNGTIAFQAPNLRAANKVVASASRLMATQCGLVEPAFLRELSALSALVETDPFRSIDRAAVYASCVTFLHPKVTMPRDLPRASARGDVEVIAWIEGAALTVAHKSGKTPGSPNAFLEKLLGQPATTRVWETVVRLVRKHGG